MGFYANLKIRFKLALGFAIVVLMAFAMGVIGFLQIHTIDKAAGVLFERGVKPVEYIGNIAADFQRLRVNLRDYIRAGDQIQHDYYQERNTKFLTRIDSAYKKLEAALPDAESKKLFAEMLTARSEYTPYFNRIVALAQLGRDDEAQAYLKSDAIGVSEGAEIDAIDNLQEYLVANAAKISAQNAVTATATGRLMLGLAVCASLLAAIMAMLIIRSIGKPLRQVLGAVLSQQEGAREKAQLVEAIANGDLSREVVVSEALALDAARIGKDEMGVVLKAVVGMSELQAALDKAFARMTVSLRLNREQEIEYRAQQVRYREEEVQRDWFKNGQNSLNIILRGDKSTAQLTEQALSFLAGYLGAGVGVFYVYEAMDAALVIAATYAVTQHKRMRERIALGEGLAGQAALERKMLCPEIAPPGYLPIGSAIGEADPVNIVVLPLLCNETLFGLLELGSCAVFSANELEFLNQSAEGIAIALSVNKSRQQVNELLEQAQAQAEELLVKQEELQQTKEEL
jgi:CHASE3 domain sensor protein